MNIGGIIAIIIVIVIILTIIAMYNNLVSLRISVKNAWSQIDVQLKRRFDLIPNLVETVKGYEKHEKDTLEKIVSLRNTYNSSNEAKDKAQLNNELNSSLKSIFAIAESYPDLKANENFLALQNELSDTEDKISYSRQFYNDTVQIYNTAIMKFPTNILANIFKFKKEELFEIDSKERENVKVKF